MKCFSYIARDATGALKKGALQASDRGAALDALKAKGLLPVSVEEGGGVAPTTSPRSRRILGLAGCVILLVFAAVLLLRLRTEAPVVEKRSPQPPAAKPKTNFSAVNSVTNLPVPNAPKAVVSEPIAKAKPKIITLPLAKRVEPAVQEPSAKVGPASADRPPTNVPARVFKTATEQVISWIANSQLGNPPPPLPTLPLGDDIETILNTDIVLYDDDDKAIEAAKINVAQAKQMMKEYLAQGGKAQDFLRYYHTELRKAHTEWREAQGRLMELYKSGDAAGARKYAEEQSKALQDKGIKPLIIPQGLAQ